MNILFEDSRNSLIANSKNVDKERDGKTRYQKRLKSHVASSTRQYNKIDMNKLFKEDILNIGIEIRGETDDYIVKISYGGFLDELRAEIERNGKLDLRIVIRALVIAFNKGDVYIHCSCPDWQYRFSYWATINDINSGEPESRPANQTNPRDSLGKGCKHVMLVLSNTSWLIKVASVITNYINYMEKHMNRQFADIMYPAIYGKKYEKPVQQDMFDNELDTDEQTLDTANIDARKKGQFTKDMFDEPNPKAMKGQVEMEIDEE